MKRQIAVLALLPFLLTVCFAQNQQASAQKQELTVETIFSPAFLAQGKGPEGMQWSPDGKKISYIQKGATGEDISLYYIDPATGKSAVLVAKEKLAALAPPTTNTKDDREKDNRERYGVAAYHWAPDSKSILFDTMGHLFLYELGSGKSLQLTTGDETTSDPKFSPDGAHLAFVRNHNLVLKPTSSAPERALTNDKDENILNGEVDWVYAEELDVRSNYFWSPDSKQIVFLQMNETPVPTYPIVDWIPRHPTDDKEKYPKAGDPNPTVKLGVMDLNGNTRWITPTTETDYYLPMFGWLRPGIVWALTLNRLQNQFSLYFIDSASGKSRMVLREDVQPYMELSDTLKFLKDSNQFLWPSWRDGHTHLYLYSYDKANPLASDAKLEHQLENGDYEITDVTGIDEQQGVVYFTANKGDALQLQLFSVKLAGGAPAQVTRQRGSHSISMPDDPKYFVDTYSSFTTAPRMVLCPATGDPCNELWRGKALEEQFTNIVTPQFVDFKADDGTLLHGAILLPKSGPLMANGKAPLLINPYGGPPSMAVHDAYSTMNAFDQILASKGIAVLKVDNRGMGGRGRAFSTVTYGKMGEVELRDQLAAVDQAIAKFPVLDTNRVAYWGWSYGGFMTLYGMTHSTRFKAGVAVAPVTDWRNYDSIYTERYMQLPQQNTKGYDDTSVVKAASNLSGRLLLVHGTSDDNVHMQNSIQFINAMINAGKPFDLQIYPQKTHGIGGQKARTHLFNRILRHFEENLKP